MTYYVFTSDAYGDEVTHSHDEALSILEKSNPTANKSLYLLQQGVYSSIGVPGGKLTLHKFTNKIPGILNKIHPSRN